MGKKEFKVDIKEWIGPVKEGKNTNWCKYVLKVSYNDAPANLDIRNVKFNEDGTHMFGKGISLTNEETDVLVDTLLDCGYGTLDKISSTAKARNALFVGGDTLFEEDDKDDWDDKGRLIVRLGKKKK